MTNNDRDRAFSPLKLICKSALNASKNNLKVSGLKLSPFKASVSRLTTPTES